MFLLRCAFWLSVVYASMSWGGVAFRHHGSFAEATAGEVGGGPALLETASDGIASLCHGREVECVRDAARLTSLVERTLGSDAVAAGAPAAFEPADDLVATSAAPLPVPDPRRRTRAAARLP